MSARCICGSHMPDACAGGSCITEMHVRTYEQTDVDTPKTESRSCVSNAREIVGLVYFVHWPTARFTKVGFSGHNRRWRPFLRRGGELMGVLAEPYPRVTVLEYQMHTALVQAGAIPAFLTKSDAAPYLGGGGGGWTECYIDRTGREVLGHLIKWASECDETRMTRMLRTRFGAIPCPNCNPTAEESA